MADEDVNDLPYGHFGRPLYDHQDGAWRFPRVPTRNLHYRLVAEVGDATRDLPPRDPVPQGVYRPRPSELVEKQFTQLASLVPDIWPVKDIVQDELRTSKTVIDASERNFDNIGDLLAFTIVRSTTNHRSTFVAACAHGLNGSILRLTQVRKAKRRWDDTGTCWLLALTLGEEHILQPMGSEPILQIRFSEHVAGQNPLLAVRLPRRTVLFRLRPGADSVDSSMSSGINLEMLYDIDSADLGGTLVDVALQPCFAPSVAVVNSRGDWKVFSVAHSNATRHKVEEWSPPVVKTPPDNATDEWRRVAWLGSGQVLAVCSRQDVTFYLLTVPHAVSELGHFRFGTLDPFRGMVDVATMPAHPNHLFILTGQCIILLELQQQHGKSQYEVSERLRIRHYHDPVKSSLYMYLWKHGTVVMLNISSRSAMIISSYRLYFDSGGQVFLNGVNNIDCCEIQPNPHANRSSTLNHYIFQAEKMRRPKSRHDAPNDIRPSAEYFTLFVMTSDLKVEERLLYCHPDNFTVRATIRPPSEANAAISAPLVQDDSDSSNDGDEPIHEPVARLARLARRLSAPLPKTPDFTQVVRALETQPFVEDLNAMLAEVRGILDMPTSSDDPPMRLLRDITEHEVFMRDTDETSATFTRLVLDDAAQKTQASSTAEQEPDSLNLHIEPVPLVRSSVESFDLGSLDLSSIQSGLVGSWITPLDKTVPARTRIAKAQLSQRIAAEVLLALHAVRIAGPSPGIQPSQPTQRSTEAPNRLFDLPVRLLPKDGPSHARELGVESAEPISVLPTPSPTGTPSITTASSRTTSPSLPQIERLRRYTTFSPPGSISLSRPINRILSHWTVGDDPATYDWLTTSNRITRRAEAEEKAEDMTERERRRLQRAADRHIRRQRKEAAASHARQLASSQATEIFSASQPVAATSSRRRVDSQPAAQVVPGSSQSFVDMATVAASQTVPGRFGGRPPPRKKRKSGF